MKDALKHITFKLEHALITLFTVFFIIYTVFKNFDTKLTQTKTLYISMATLDEYDISSRINLFYKLVLISLIGIPIVYIFLNKISLSIKTRQLKTISLLSVYGLLLILTDIYGITNTFAYTLIFFLTVILLLFNLLITDHSNFKILKESSLFLKLLILSTLLQSAIQFLGNSDPFISEQGVGLFLIIYATFTTLTLFINKRFGLFFNTIFQYCLPLASVPILIFAATESYIFFSIKQSYTAPYRLIFVLGLFLFIVISILFKKYRKVKLDNKKLFSRFFIPATLLSFLILTLYNPLVAQSTELFELANFANAQMRIFNFNEIPFVDFMSSHMFSEQFYGIIYHLIYGYDASLDFLSYYFLYEVLFYFIIYKFLMRIFKNPYFSVFMIIYFPFSNILFGRHLFFAILVYFAIEFLLKKQSIRNYLILYILILSTILWRLDTGASTLFTTIIYFPLAFFVKGKQIQIKTLLKSTAIITGICFIILALAVYIRSYDYLLENFKSFLHYASANQAHGYTNIAKNFNQQFYTLHVLMPVISVLAILFSIFKLRLERAAQQKNHVLLMASTFLFLIYITNFQRGLVRHSFIEATDGYLLSTFIIALTLFLLSFIKQTQPSHKLTAFLGLSFFLVIGSKYFPMNFGVSKMEVYLTDNTLDNLEDQFNQKNLKGRSIIDEQLQHTKISKFKSFLDENLSEDETFLDFSNAPMLYYYTQRSIPSYFCQNLQNIIDDYLQLEQIKRVKKAKTPVVIYSNYPKGWGDQIDNIPNPMRHYLLSEFIYSVYSPLKIINAKSIWVDKSKQFEPIDVQIEKDTLIRQPKVYHYEKSAHIIANHLKTKKINELDLPIKQDKERTTRYHAYYKVDLNKISTDNLYLKLKLKDHSIQKDIRIELFNDTLLAGTNIFTTVLNEQTYITRISNHYLIKTLGVNMIKVILSDSNLLEGLYLLKDERYVN